MWWRSRLVLLKGCGKFLQLSSSRQPLSRPRRCHSPEYWGNSSGWARSGAPTSTSAESWKQHKNPDAHNLLAGAPPAAT